MSVAKPTSVTSIYQRELATHELASLVSISILCAHAVQQFSRSSRDEPAYISGSSGTSQCHRIIQTCGDESLTLVQHCYASNRPLLLRNEAERRRLYCASNQARGSRLLGIVHQSQIMSKLLLLDMASNDHQVGRRLMLGLGLGYGAQHRRQHVRRIVGQSALRADIPYQATFGIYDKAVTLLQRKYSVS